ncbi:MAG: GDP-mannose 4,6-dehydratase [Desulfurococcus sp.]
MRILVTGGTGFIGHSVARYLVKRGYDVVVLIPWRDRVLSL